MADGRADFPATDLSDMDWDAIRPVLPTKMRGIKRVDDRRVLNGIVWRLRSGRPWAAIPPRYGPHTTCQSRFYRWREAGVWDRIVEAIRQAHGTGIAFIDAAALGIAPPHRSGPRAEDPIIWFALTD